MLASMLPEPPCRKLSTTAPCRAIFHTGLNIVGPFTQPEHMDAEAGDGVSRDGNDVAMRAKCLHEQKTEIL